MEVELQLCRAGTISFDEFARRTAKDWERLCRMLLRRWQAPMSVLDERDLVQEALIGAWLALRDYDPTRGTTLRAFVIFNAVDKAKKHLHSQRKALRRDDKAPSRLMIPVSALAREGEEEVDIAGLLTFLADQEDRLEAKRAFQAIPVSLVPALECYVREGDFSGAAWGLLDNTGASRLLGVTTHQEAREAVEEAVGILVDGTAWDLLADQERRESLGIETLSDARRAVLA